MHSAVEEDVCVRCHAALFGTRHSPDSKKEGKGGICGNTVFSAGAAALAACAPALDLSAGQPTWRRRAEHFVIDIYSLSPCSKALRSCRISDVTAVTPQEQKRSRQSWKCKSLLCGTSETVGRSQNCLVLCAEKKTSFVAHDISLDYFLALWSFFRHGKLAAGGQRSRASRLVVGRFPRRYTSTFIFTHSSLAHPPFAFKFQRQTCMV